jgi:hypothetical protein
MLKNYTLLMGNQTNYIHLAGPLYRLNTTGPDDPYGNGRVLLNFVLFCFFFTIV